MLHRVTIRLTRNNIPLSCAFQFIVSRSISICLQLYAVATVTNLQLLKTKQQHASDRFKKRDYPTTIPFPGNNLT